MAVGRAGYKSGPDPELPWGGTAALRLQTSVSFYWVVAGVDELYWSNLEAMQIF